MSEEILEEWLVSTAEVREKLLAYAQSPLPTDAGERQVDVSTALQHGQDAGELLADAEEFLSKKIAQETLSARANDTYDANTVKAVVRGNTANIQRLRDGIHVVYRTIQDRRFAILSLGRQQD